jgi:hypothetical protein
MILKRKLLGVPFGLPGTPYHATLRQVEEKYRLSTQGSQIDRYVPVPLDGASGSSRLRILSENNGRDTRYWGNIGFLKVTIAYRCSQLSFSEQSF